MIAKHYLYLSKITAQMVTSTSSGILFTNAMNFIIKILILKLQKPWFLHAWSIFFKGAHLQNYGVEKYFNENPVEVRSFDV